MRETPYPMAAVRTQRDLARRQAMDQLAAAQVELQRAELTLAAARAALSELQQRRSAELVPGAASTPREQPKLGSELARRGAYGARLQSRARELTAQLRAAESAVTERQRAVRMAELDLAQAHAQREVIERHHAQFQAGERKASERAEELEVEDLRRHPVPRI
jgi:hypothetical protein